MNNQIPNFNMPNPGGMNHFNPGMNNNDEIRNLEMRVNRLENRVFGNNWGIFGGYNSPSMMNTETREYTTGNYIL